MTSSAPASRKLIRSSTSSVALTHMTGTAASAGVARISRQSSTADFVPGDAPQDQQLVVGGLRERVVRIGRPGDGVPGVGQDLGDGFGIGRLGFEEQDGAGGHEASAVDGLESDGSGRPRGYNGRRA